MAGVPVPRRLLDESDGWVNRGEITTEFLSPALEAELWTWETAEGICMALPRWFEDDDQAQFFGLICFGYETGNTCFWDNEAGDYLARYQTHSIDALIGGAALDKNAQGVCSNCHAGENPFIIDPYEAGVFGWLWSDGQTEWEAIVADEWPTPIVHEDWIGNPGPISSLGPVAGGQGECTECHNAAMGMRFPLILEEHTSTPGYCGSVLGMTIEKSATAPMASMPPWFASTQTMNVQAERLWDYCEKGPPSDYGEEVDFDPPGPSVLSPLNLGPYYACADTVAVRNAKLGATVELSTDTQGPFFKLATGPTVVFELDEPLAKNENVYATQSLDGITSPSRFERTQVWEGDVPTPKFIYTPLYACAGSVMVENVPGADVVIEHRRQGNLVQTAETSSFAAHSVVDLPLEDFQVGDKLFAQQRLCEPSPQSPAKSVELFTDEMSTPTVGTVFEGQPALALSRLVQGGSLEVVHDSQGSLVAVDSNPGTNRRLGLLIISGVANEPLEQGDELTITHRLCPDDLRQVVTEVVACNPAGMTPNVLPAFEGNGFIVVEDGIPGATIDVYAKGSHIGSGSGSEINLTRNLAKDETIQVTQSLLGCTPSTAFELTVL